MFMNQIATIKHLLRLGVYWNVPPIIGTGLRMLLALWSLLVLVPSPSPSPSPSHSPSQLLWLPLLLISNTDHPSAGASWSAVVRADQVVYCS